jgi:DNA polymerase
MKTSIDYETYYDADCSITKGLENYLTHPKFEAYMVSIYSEDNFAWVGPPEMAPWDKLEGHTVVAHNRSFDEPVHNFLISQGKIPQTKFGDFQCTADMSAYHGWGRSLKESLKNALGLNMAKDIRDNMKGRNYGDLSDEEKKDLAHYALYDAKGSVALWGLGEKDWPEHERRLSHETTRMCQQGLPVDPDTMDECIHTLEDSLEKAIDVLPWAEQQAGALSPKEWASWCRSQGVLPPKSMAKDDPEVQEWMKQNPKQGRVLEATHTLRGANSLLKKFVTMRERVGSDNRLSYGMKYFGAHTGRDSGDAGFNVQNMPREGMYGADLRSCIRAGAGKILLVADLSQIEARCVAWLAGEQELLDAAATGVDWYEAMARGFHLYKGEEPLKVGSPTLRHTMKQMCLGCQYQMSAKKFASITGVEWEDAQTMVRMFRAKMPKLVSLWSELEKDMRRAGTEEAREYRIGLPSGRDIIYRNVELKHGLSAEILKTGKRQRVKFWSGMLIENATQAFARDVFMDRVLALRDNGHNIVLRVHDEVVIEADQDNWREAAEDIHRVMTLPPEWCRTLPLGTDVDEMERYTK